jgi:hypothetical protein
MIKVGSTYRMTNGQLHRVGAFGHTDKHRVRCVFSMCEGVLYCTPQTKFEELVVEQVL